MCHKSTTTVFLFSIIESSVFESDIQDIALLSEFKFVVYAFMRTQVFHPFGAIGRMLWLYRSMKVTFNFPKLCQFKP